MQPYREAYCWQCAHYPNLIFETDGCSRCGKRTGWRYLLTWPPPPLAFDMKVEISYSNQTEKKPGFSSELKRGVSADGRVATVLTEFDRRDPDKSQRRYVKRVITAGGHVAKNVDGFLINQGLHGDVGRVQDPPAPPIQGDPMTVRAGVRWW